MSYDEDPPTRRLPVPPREPLPRERVPPAGDAGPPPAGPGGGPGLSEVEVYDLEQRMAKLRSWLVALAVVAVLALVVAAIALVSGGEDSSSARTPAGLRNDVEKLEERVGDRATKGQLDSVKDDVSALQKAVEAVGESSGGDSTTTATTPAPDVSGLESQLSDLAARVEALEQAPAAEGTATEGVTP